MHLLLWTNPEDWGQGCPLKKPEFSLICNVCARALRGNEENYKLLQLPASQILILCLWKQEESAPILGARESATRLHQKIAPAVLLLLPQLLFSYFTSLAFVPHFGLGPKYAIWNSLFSGREFTSHPPPPPFWLTDRRRFCKRASIYVSLLPASARKGPPSCHN